MTSPQLAALADAFVRCRDLDAPLNERLDAYSSAVRELIPAYADAVDRLVTRLSSNGAGASAPQPGELMPAFVLPDETGYVFLRFEEPWRALTFTVFTFVFLIPFIGLMNMATKKSPFWLALFSLIILGGMWMERHVLVMPSLNPDHVWVGLPEIGVTLGFIGLFGFAVQNFVSRYPVVKVSDVLAGQGAHGH